MTHMETLMEECEPAPHLLHPHLAVRKRRLRQVCKGAEVEKVFCSLPLECGGWSWMEWKRGSFYALQVAEHGRRQKVTDAVKGRSKTPEFQKISGWMSSARPLRHVFS